MFKRLSKKAQKGFTIIEVMIVLAIAGLIMVVVLIAVPQLQRSQRNNARQANIARVSTELGNYAGNNNGKIPTTSTEINEFLSRYLGGLNYEDPSTGANMPLVVGSGKISNGTVPSLSDDTAQVTINNNGTATDPSDDYPEVTGGGDLGVIYYETQYQCDGEKQTSVSGGNRNYVLVSALEGGAVYCLDNK